MSKQIVLFIVEGFSDQNSFENILNHLSNDRIKYKVIGGDITLKSGTYNIKRKIKDKVLEFIDEPKNKFDLTDIKKIVHLVDIDGVFINNEYIIEDKSLKSLKYEDGKCFVKDKNQIIIRNANKKRVLTMLSNTNYIDVNDNCIPYEIYYFSCNLEHVLHNNPNVETEAEKIELSNQFADQYLGYENKFVTDINESEYSTQSTYKESWKKIIENDSEFLRLTNFNLFFKEE